MDILYIYIYTFYASTGFKDTLSTKPILYGVSYCHGSQRFLDDTLRVPVLDISKPPSGSGVRWSSNIALVNVVDKVRWYPYVHGG